MGRRPSRARNDTPTILITHAVGRNLADSLDAIALKYSMIFLTT